MFSGNLSIYPPCFFLPHTRLTSLELNCYEDHRNVFRPPTKSAQWVCAVLNFQTSKSKSYSASNVISECAYLTTIMTSE